MLKSAVLKDHIFPYKDAVIGGCMAFLVFSLAWLGLAEVMNTSRMQHKSETHQINSAETLNQQINQELKRADSLLEGSRAKIESENKYLVPEGRLEPVRGKMLETPGLERIDSANPAAEVTKDLEGIKNPQGRLENPADLIDQSLADDQWQSDYDRKYQRLYVKKFLDNAEKAGYQIKLSDNLEVISIRPINQPKALRFPQSK